MKSKPQAMVLGAFVGDALALGPHWVYNTRVIGKKLGRVDRYFDPMTSHHKGKKAGDFTHYGDQMLVLLEAIQPEGKFDPQRFADHWKALFDDYTGYFDHATKDTLANLAAGKGIDAMGSTSTELAGAGRIAPLVYIYHDDPEALVAAARRQTAMTHNDALVVSGAEFFARTGVAILEGAAPREAMETIVAKHFQGAAIEELVTAGLESRALESRQAVADFGQMCAVDAALPASVHLVAKYADDFQTALVENVMAGGDSAARGMLVGMLLGAYLGIDAIPPKWLTELGDGDKIIGLLTTLNESLGKSDA